MALFKKCPYYVVCISQIKNKQIPFLLPLWYSQVAHHEQQEEFRVLQLVKKSAERTSRRKIRKAELLPPRASVMPVDQEWSSVWPGPRSFHPASVPLPLHQGYVQKGAPPGKFANAELMKIPNFLHLTPPAVKKHCEVLRNFCTPWPENLNDKNCSEHFPIEITTSDYCFSSPDIREPLARIVILKVKLSALNLDAHAKDKFLRLVKERYDPATDIVTITTDRCPLRKQNYDYALYILTALYHESQKNEPWESEKSLADLEYYDWDKNVSRKSALSILNWPQPFVDNENVELSPAVEVYKNAVSALMNNGEDEYTITKYKEATRKFFNLLEFPA